MFLARDGDDVRKIRRTLERVGHLSDNIFSIGPFGIGLDGLLAWIPGVGEAYSVGAGGFLILEGLRARVPLHTLVEVGLLIAARSAIGVPAAALLGPLYPLSGGLVDVFRAHRWSAKLLMRAIDRTVYIDNATGFGAEAAAQAKRDHKRVVVLKQPLRGAAATA